MAIALPLLLAGCFDSIYPTSSLGSTCNGGTAGGGFCLSDGRLVTYFVAADFSGTARSRIFSAVATEYNAPTSLVFQYDETPTTSAGDNQETDLMIGTGSVPGSDDGIAWCEDADGSAVGGPLCDQHYVRFESTSPSYGLICHEVGHSVGLTHGANADPPQSNDSEALGCMRKPVGSTASTSAHNITQIDATYASLALD